MNTHAIRYLSPTIAIFLIVGCNKKADTSLNFTNAINTYYSAHPACLWS